MASTALRRVVVIGGSGNLGTYIVKELARNASFKLTVVSRKSSQATFDPSINVIRVDDGYPEAEMFEVFKGQDAVVASFNHRSNGAQQGMIDAAVKAGVKRFIPADFGSNAENRAVLDLFPPLKGKTATIQYLKSKESPSFSWTSIVTGLFVDLAIKNGFMGYNLAAHEATIWDSGDGRFSCSTRPTIAKAVANVLLNPEQTANQYTYVSSFELTQNEILYSLEKHMSGKPWEVKHVTSEEQIKSGREAMAKGDFMGTGKLALAASYAGTYGGDFVAEGKLANEMLDISKEKLDDVVRGILRTAGVL